VIKSFIKNSAIYTIATVLTRGIAIFLVPIYTRYLTPAEYGMIDYFMILASIINLTIALEISQAVVRYYQDAVGIEEKRNYVATAFIFTIFVYVLYFITSFVFASELSYLFLDDEHMSALFMIASGAIATNGIFYFVQNQLKFEIRPKDFAVVSIANVIVLACVAIYLLVVVGMKVESIFIAQIIANIVSSMMALYMSRQSYGVIFIYSKFKEMVSFSYPLVFSGVAVFVAMYIDRIAIKDLLGLEELGIYGLAYRFASIAGLVMIGFQSSLMPLVYKHHQEENTPKDISKIFNIFSLFALFVVAGSIVFSREIIILFTTESFYGASSLIAILVMAVFFSNMYIFAPGIGIAKKTKLTAFIMTLGALLNLILNYTLIPIMGINGSAMATLTSAMVIFLLYVIIAYKYYPIPYKTKELLIAFVLVLTSGYLVENTFVGISFLSIIVKIVYLLMVLVLVSLVLVDKKYLNKMKLKINRKNNV
jgi:O-antigen/teichoic acid export membrane protein